MFRSFERAQAGTSRFRAGIDQGWVKRCKRLKREVGPRPLSEKSCILTAATATPLFAGIHGLPLRGWVSSARCGQVSSSSVADSTDREDSCHTRIFLCGNYLNQPPLGSWAELGSRAAPGPTDRRSRPRHSVASADSKKDILVLSGLTWGAPAKLPRYSVRSASRQQRSPALAVAADAARAPPKRQRDRPQQNP
jgi:hypothetical protein